MGTKNIDSLCIHLSNSLQTAIERMNGSRLGIVLVVDNDNRLLGTISDGDIRRAVLARLDLTLPVESLLEIKAGTKYAKPIFAYEGEDKQIYLDLLKSNSLSHLPILDRRERVVGLVTSDDFVSDLFSSLHAVVMAGGKGSRLYPFTEDLPKPMLPVGKKPLLEIILSQLRSVGIQKVNLTVHHKPEKIMEHFGNGKEFGVDLNYVSEESPLGTAGALGLLEDSDQPLLVINGDILTDVDIRAMYRFHKEHGAHFTVAVRSYDFDVPYGVIECEKLQVKSVKEKPKMSVMVNAGIYLLEPCIKKYIPVGKAYPMTDLIQKLIDVKLNVVGFPIHENWLDIGSHLEYEKAQEEAKKFIL